MLARGRAAARSSSLVAPVKGWNTRVALADMDPEFAIILDNWIPRADRCVMRRGYAEHATGLPGPVETLMRYVGINGTEAMFAASDGNIFDVTSAGAVGSAVVTSLSNDRWQYVNVGNAGGQFLFACNGADTPVLYNGTSWSTTTLTGPTVANLIWCNLHQRRLWVGEKNSLSAWYGGTNAITGTFVEFSLEGIADKGGFIQAMGTWSRDSGDGLDDIAVFVTSEGQFVVYQGTDPDNASTWSLVGVFNLGDPIGRRCLIKAGPDLIAITQDGFVPMSASLSMDRTQQGLVSINREINPTVNDAVRDFGSLFGWQPLLYAKGQLLIFNVPQGNDVYHQYVFNTETQAACRFTGINARCWEVVNQNAYFGGADAVYLWDTGAADNGGDIEADALQAFNYFGSPGNKKRFSKARPVFQGNDAPAYTLEMNIDFEVLATEEAPVSAPTSDALIWDVGNWDEQVWGGTNNVYDDWRGVRGYGYAGAARVRVSDGISENIAWIATTFIYTVGGQM